MPGWFHNAASRPEIAEPRLAPGLRLYAIGDIHGRADLLEQIHGLIREDARTAAEPRRRIVYLGDYVDRGPQSRDVIDALASRPPDGFESVHLKGNHEAALLDFIADAATAAPWLRFGGGETLRSYGVTPPNPDDPAGAQRARQEFAARLPAIHRRFLEGLELTHQEGGFFFAHAGIRPGVPLDRQRECDLLWIREPFLRSHADFGKIVVHGHSISDRPEFRPNRIGIDTGAYATGRLTCLVASAASLSLIHT